MEQYADSYSRLVRNYFPDLSERIEPFTKNEIGIWVWQKRFMFQHRERSATYPQPVVFVDDDVAESLLNYTAPPELYRALRPGGKIQLFGGQKEFVQKLPQEVAWERIRKQVTYLISKQLLDESSARFLLEERIWRVLRQEPSWAIDAQDHKSKYWQRLVLC